MGDTTHPLPKEEKKEVGGRVLGDTANPTLKEEKNAEVGGRGRHQLFFLLQDEPVAEYEGSESQKAHFDELYRCWDEKSPAQAQQELT